ncbi:MAG: hypothetical protein JWN45_2945 [Acidobacteriaceae bacterium]|nr:hypothetical protein [Acidobacteriaceae bacterium]
MRSISVTLLCILCCVVAGGQTATVKKVKTTPAVEPVRAILGIEDVEVQQRFGEPVTFKRKGPRDASYERALSLWPGDYYTRKTLGNEYELTYHYGVDDSQSRLHPKMRSTTVEFRIDHPRAIFEILSDIDEARVLCVKGCVVYTKDNPEFTSQPTLCVTTRGDSGESDGFCVEWSRILPRSGEFGYLSEPVESIKLRRVNLGVRASDFERKKHLGEWKPEEIASMK